MRPFRELRVWQVAHQVTLDVYRITREFPQAELYGLTTQMRRSAASVPTNIVEGSVRSEAEFRNFLRIALGSSTELEYQLLLSRDLGYLPEEKYQAMHSQVESIKRMLTVFIQRSGSAAARTDGRRPMADGLPPDEVGA